MSWKFPAVKLTALGASSFILYHYITDSRAGVHKFLLLPMMRQLMDAEDAHRFSIWFLSRVQARPSALIEGETGLLFSGWMSSFGALRDKGPSDDACLATTVRTAIQSCIIRDS